MKAPLRSTHIHWLRCFIAGAAVCCALASTQAQDAPQGSGQMIVPARGIFDLRDGTVEAWVKLTFEPHEPVEGYVARGQLFLFRVPKADNDLGAEMSIFFASTRSGHKGDNNRSFTFLRAGFAIDGKEIPHPLVVECSGWKRDEWHHIAVTWEGGRRMAVYFDGQEVVNRGEAAAMEFPVSTERDVPANAQILIGSPYDQQWNGLTIDELRLSSIARRPGALGSQQTPVQPDPFTMLLENFDTVKRGEKGAKFVTTPAVIAATALPQTYNISDGRLVPGRAGEAWQIGR